MPICLTGFYIDGAFVDEVRARMDTAATSSPLNTGIVLRDTAVTTSAENLAAHAPPPRAGNGRPRAFKPVLRSRLPTSDALPRPRSR